MKVKTLFFKKNVPDTEKSLRAKLFLSKESYKKIHFPKFYPTKFLEKNVYFWKYSKNNVTYPKMENNFV